MIARIAAALLVAFGLLAMPAAAQKGPPPAPAEIAIVDLPPEARATIALIRKHGPYPYAKDNAVFGNREARLPRRKYGYYHEFTVKTPGERTRGARRIVTGKGGEMYYTDDHYNTFRKIRE